jgi:ribosomal protein L9
MHRREWRDDRKTLVKNGFRTHFLTSQSYSARAEVAVLSTASTAKKNVSARSSSQRRLDATSLSVRLSSNGVQGTYTILSSAVGDQDFHDAQAVPRALSEHINFNFKAARCELQAPNRVASVPL